MVALLKFDCDGMVAIYKFRSLRLFISDITGCSIYCSHKSCYDLYYLFSMEATSGSTTCKKF